MFGNHTRQTAIIRLTRGIAGLLLLWGTPVAAAQRVAQSAPAACITCIALHVSAQDAGALAGLPAGSLEGLTVAVDRLPEAGLLDRLAATGAAIALVLREPAPTDEAVFEARSAATAAHAVRPGIRVLVEAPVVPERLAPYVDGRVDRGPSLSAPDASALVQVSRQPSSALLLVRVDTLDPQVVAAFAAQRAFGTEVVAAAPLTVEEIVARHQAQRRRQEHVVERWIASGTTTLMFEVPGFVAPVTITAETIVYVAPGVTELEQRDIRVNGAAIAGGSAAAPPQLPLIEAARVTTPPLTITLNESYRYALEGRDRVDGADVYVVSFRSLAPAASGLSPKTTATTARGRAWIDASTFALRRLDTIQGGLRGAIVSSEQREQFGPFQVGADTVWLPVHTAVFQMYEGAGHRTPIHRAIATPTYAINPADFHARLEAAHASPHVMLRETPDGFRYLLREGGAGETRARAVAPRAGERIRTAAFGVLIDPNITTPLPFAGVSYVDLNLFGTGAQLNAFFGGSYGQLSWSVPSLGGTRWQANGRAFAIAAKYNDRAFRGGLEQYTENITQRPAHVSAGVMRALTPRLRARLEYQLDFTAFDRADTTATTFVVPADAIVHGLLAAAEVESGPWLARVWWNPARRQHWQPWGPERTAPDRPGVTSPEFDEAASFQRAGMVVARTLALGRTVGSRVEASWMEGINLDRFSRYSFGAFENRLHGYPTASVRYDRGGVLRSSTSWSARGWRVDAFGDIAVVRDPGFGDALRGYPGIGAAFETAGPFRTLWSVEWGYGFKALRGNGARGTQALRITAYRTF